MSGLLLHPRTKMHTDTLRKAGVYIAHGPKGIGKTSFVKSTLSDFSPLVIEPDEKGVIGVKMIKELVTRLKYKSTNNDTALIIDDAQAMTAAAQNAFLKTLEEMPLNVRIVLIAHQLYALLPTVRSRAHQLYIPAPTNKQFEDWLKELDKSDQDYSQVGVYTGGMPAAVFNEADVEREHLEKIPQLFDDDLYIRLVTAKQLTDSLPAVLTYIIAYIRNNLRRDPDSEDWQHYLDAAIGASRLQESRVSQRSVLDLVALAGAMRG